MAMTDGSQCRNSTVSVAGRMVSEGASARGSSIRLRPRRWWNSVPSSTGPSQNTQAAAMPGMARSRVEEQGARRDAGGGENGGGAVEAGAVDDGVAAVRIGGKEVG